MPNRSDSHRWLDSLGRLLPRRLRERVFEPACYDLLRDQISAPRPNRLFRLRVLAALFYVAGANFPRVMVENRRLSRLGLVFGSLALLAAVALVGIGIVLRQGYS